MVLDNVEFIMYMKFEKLLMTRCKDIQRWGFSPICDHPLYLFKNWALSLLYPYGALTSCKKLQKTNEQSLRYSKTDGPGTLSGDKKA